MGIQVYHKGVQAYFHYYWYDVDVKNTSSSSLSLDSTNFQVGYAASLVHNHCRYLHFQMSSHRRLYINWALLQHRLRIQKISPSKLNETLVIHLHDADTLASTHRACCARKRTTSETLETTSKQHTLLSHSFIPPPHVLIVCNLFRFW